MPLLSLSHQRKEPDFDKDISKTEISAFQNKFSLYPTMDGVVDSAKYIAENSCEFMSPLSPSWFSLMTSPMYPCDMHIHSRAKKALE